jgi:hypothetical protein
MTKSEAKELTKIKLFHSMGHHDTAARSLAYLIRATKTSSNKAEMMKTAEALKLTANPDFIV